MDWNNLNKVKKEECRIHPPRSSVQYDGLDPGPADPGGGSNPSQR